jgi:WD40 repeat protein
MVFLILNEITYKCNNNSIYVVDNHTQRIIKTFPLIFSIPTNSQFRPYASCISISYDKKHLLIGSFYGYVKAIDVNDGKMSMIFKGHKLPILCIITGKGEDIITCSSDKHIKIWNSKGVCVMTYSGHHAHGTSILYSKRNNRIYSSGDENTIKAWNYDSKVEVANITIPAHESQISSLVWVKKEETFASSSWDKTIKLWDCNKLLLLKTIGIHETPIKFLIPFTDSRFIFSYEDDRKISVWEVDTGVLFDYDNVWAHLDSACISPNCMFLAYKPTIFGEVYFINKGHDSVNIIYKDIIFKNGAETKQNAYLFPNGNILEIQSNRITTISKNCPTTRCDVIIDSMLCSIINEDPEFNLTFKAESKESALLWQEAILALVHHLSTHESTEVPAYKIISLYRFDIFQSIYQNSGPFGLLVPKTIIELVGEFILT